MACPHKLKERNPNGLFVCIYLYYTIWSAHLLFYVPTLVCEIVEGRIPKKRVILGYRKINLERKESHKINLERKESRKINLERKEGRKINFAHSNPIRLQNNRNENKPQNNRNEKRAFKIYLDDPFFGNAPIVECKL